MVVKKTEFSCFQFVVGWKIETALLKFIHFICNLVVVEYKNLLTAASVSQSGDVLTTELHDSC